MAPDLDAGHLNPYASFLILEFTGANPVGAVPLLTTFIQEFLDIGRRDVTVVADGIAGIDLATFDNDPDADLTIEGLAYRVDTTPRWGKDRPFTDSQHELVVLTRRTARRPRG